MHPSKSLGQNFLIDGNIRDIILDAADVSSCDSILEVGPGVGALTEKLIQRAARVTAVEIDRRLHGYLQTSYASSTSLELLRADILDLNIDELMDAGINKVVANLPYSVGTRFLVDLSRAVSPPQTVVVTVQQEVAERIVARPGGKEYSMLSAWLQLVYTAEIRKSVARTCFWPRPKVASAIVLMHRRDDAQIDSERRQCFYAMTKYAFSQRRKQLATSMRNAPSDIRIPADQCRAALAELDLDERARPTSLSVADWWHMAAIITPGHTDVRDERAI
jgi:16S rRNA (adenine1518-N6/adenine1519-N6)-dimethyltransferase